MKTASYILMLTITVGCSSGMPDVATVKQHMAPEQLALGDPIVNTVGIILVPVPAGEFQMGTAVNEASAERRLEQLLESPDIRKKLESGEITEEDLTRYAQWQFEEDQKRKDGPDTPQHSVRITKPFYLSVCEVTQQQYESVMAAAPWKGQPLVEEGLDYAATYISWNDAVEFCSKLSARENVDYRLPTEAEWEYACRAGTATTYSFGEDGKQLADYAWYDANAYKAEEQYAHLAGQKSPNAWAIHDMHGNVCEWCSDWYGRYDGKQEVIDPTGSEKGRVRVWRGG